jgi:excisionase family DNA binding protein
MANLSMNRMERGRYETTYDIKRKWRQMMEDRFACAWPHADRWFSVDDIAAYLGIKRDTVYRWISERNMTGHKIGRLWKFRKEEVDEWVKSDGARRTKNNKEEP